MICKITLPYNLIKQKSRVVFDKQSARKINFKPE